MGAFEIQVKSKRGPDVAPPGGAEQPSDGKIQIRREDLVEDRYHRLRLISWWDQERLKDAVVVVAGAGALGNEAIKNMALLGVGRMFVCDTDAIETSNLTRSVLFRLGDVGRHKAEVACERAVDMNPDVRAVPIKGDLRYVLGLGLLRRADVVLGCLDNIAARVYLSRHAYRLGKPSVDAGLDTLNGDVYTFTPPESACYECRLKEADRKEFKRRQSCLKLSRKETATGKVPTAPTIAAIASGLQTQIAVRLIHGMPVPAGRRLGLYGMSDVFFDYHLDVSPECPAHEWIECLRGREVTETPLTAAGSTLDDLLATIRAHVGPQGYLSLEDDREVIVGLACAACGVRREALALAGALSEDDARCAGCHEPMAPDVRSTFDGTEGLGGRRLVELGLPPLHIVRGRDDESGREVLIELTGDVPTYFG
ncbi:MAG: ThiF family adenylyltransferase [Planctomycetota bacterium]|nr:ThiF family adenylyltransferase [Planctomycetota bacterium]